MTVYTVSEGHTGNLLRPLKIAIFRAGFWRNVEDGHQELVSCLFPWHLCPFCSTLKTSQTSQFRKMIHRAWRDWFRVTIIEQNTGFLCGVAQAGPPEPSPCLGFPGTGMRG